MIWRAMVQRPSGLVSLRHPLFLFGWFGEVQALLAGALAGLNLWVVRGKGVTFKNLCLPRTKRLPLMIRGWLPDPAHAQVSSFQFHGGICYPLIVQQQFYQEKSRLGKGNSLQGHHHVDDRISVGKNELLGQSACNKLAISSETD